MRDNTKNEISGTIQQIRDLEDCIRASKKYSEWLKTIRQFHPVQGEDTESRVFSKHYEYFPTMEVSIDMLLKDAWDLLFMEDKQGNRVEHIQILFRYDYRCNEAKICIKDCANAIKRICETCPGFSASLNALYLGQKVHRVARIIEPKLNGTRSLLKQLNA